LSLHQQLCGNVISHSGTHVILNCR
jgi:hypothetical protein